MMDDLEGDAFAWSQETGRNGYGFANIPAGRVRVHYNCRRGGSWAYYLNNVEVTRHALLRAIDGRHWPPPNPPPRPFTPPPSLLSALA